MDLVVPVLVLAAVLAAVLTALLVPIPSPRGRPGRRALRRAVRHAGRRWRAQVHLWDCFLARDPWPSARRGDAYALHWVGGTLEGAVLPGAHRPGGDGSASDRPPPAG